MQLFDSHCHLDDRSYEGDRDAVLERAKAANVARLMVVGITAKSSAKAVALAKAHPQIVASVGIHPHDAATCSDENLASLQDLARTPEVRAWGETGLDFNRMYSPRPVQEKWFLRQLECAAQLDLPLIFHERDSKSRFLEMLRHHFPAGCQGVVHCFSGTTAELKAYLDLGLFIGLTGILTIKTRGEDLRRQVLQIPAERILIETDAPYLTPAPQKNQYRRNEPAFVRSVFIKLAELKQTAPDVLANRLWENTCGLFGIDPET